MKILVIDDNQQWLGSLGRALQHPENVILAECHSVEDAVAAISEHQPEIILLDHQLTEGGDEGFYIYPRIPEGVLVYSTTGSPEAAEVYRRNGVEHIGKNDMNTIKKIAGLQG